MTSVGVDTSVDAGSCPTVRAFDRFIFIVGAPRCGTTTLSRFLKDHPAICFPRVKETHFFAQQDLRDLSDGALRHYVEENYLQRFFQTRPDRRVGADASVTYLYTPEQLEPIVRLWPESRFVIAVRDPFAMLPSLHQRLLYVGAETIPKFADAWAAVKDRAIGRKVPRTCPDEKFLRYDEAARFSTYLERLFKVVGRDRCHVVLLDDLAAHPAKEYRRLMDFAGLEPQSAVDFSPRRRGWSVRLPLLQRILKQPTLIARMQASEGRSDRPPPLESPRQSRTTAAIMSLRKRLLRWNRVAAQTASLEPSLQREIRDQLGAEIERLGTMLDRDLSLWMDVSRGSSIDKKDTNPLPRRAVAVAALFLTNALVGQDWGVTP